MKKDKLVGKIFAMAVACLMIASMLGGMFAGVVYAGDSDVHDNYNLATSETNNILPCVPCGQSNLNLSENSTNSDWSTKPVIVNIQVDLEKEGDQEYVYAILDQIELQNGRTTVFATGEFAAAHPDIIRSIESRGHQIAVHGWQKGEDLTLLSYAEQRSLISRAFGAVRGPVSKPEEVVDFKPQGYKFNDDTIRIAQELGAKSVSGIFTCQEPFCKCPYAQKLGKITFPYPVTNNFWLVPISEVSIDSKETLLDDEYIDNPQEFLDYLIAKYTEQLQTKDPLVIAVHPSVTGADAAKLNAFSQFVDYVTNNNGRIKPLSSLTHLTTYIPSLQITSAPQSAHPGETVTITVQFGAAIYCPSYYFRIYGKYSSEGSWGLRADHYHGVQTGSFSFSRSFTIPEPPPGDSSYTVRVVGQGCAGTCWPTPSAYERMDETTVNIAKPPEIEEIIITGIPDAENPMTRHVTTFEATITKPSGWEIWAIDWFIEDMSTGKWTDITPLIGLIIPQEKIEHRFKAGTHGDKKVICTIYYRNEATGATGLDQESKEFKLFFEKRGRDFWWQQSDNWYYYWSTSNDGAASYDRTSATYRYGGGDYSTGTWGSTYPSTGKITLYNLASMDADVGTYAYGGLNININAQGIDCVEVVLAHEREHVQIYRNWQPGGVWYTQYGPRTTGPGGNDRDGDWLPNEVENATPGFKWDNAYSFPSYPISGGDDQEVWCDWVAQGKTGISSNDWAYEGKQSDPKYRRIVSENGTAATLTDIYSDYGKDTDGDGLYDSLSIEVGVNVTIAGTYRIFGNLYDSNENMLCAENLTYLNIGNQSVLLNFDGAAIRQKKVDGPYNLRYLTLFGMNFTEERFNAYNTSAYSYTQFEKQVAELTSTYSNTGTDSDGDGLYDHLTIEVGVNTTIAGNYTIDGYLDDVSGNEIAWAQNSTYLDIGVHSAILNFDGISIYKHGIDGPYSLENVSLRDENSNYTDFVYDAYNTSAYSYTDFQRPSASFRDAYSDYGVDTNGDGLYEYLTISVGVNVTTAGNYAITGWLSGSEIAWTSTTTYLDVGEQSVPLNFDGMTIYDHGVNGPYNLSGLALYNANGSPVDYRSNACSTSAYEYADFQQGGTLTGTVTDNNGNPAADVYIYAIGPTTTSTITDINGSYNITGLQSGSYTIRVEPLSPNLVLTSTSIVINAGQIMIRNFTLQAVGSIAGNITDADGIPIPNVSLYLSGYETARYRTDESGHYVIPRLHAGTYTVNVDASETIFTDASDTVSVVIGQTTALDFILPVFAGGQIAGRVTDENGDGVYNAYVSVSGPSWSSGYTNATGYYFIPRLLAGNYIVTASPPYGVNLIRSSTTAEVIQGETTTVDFVLQAGGIIAGRVTDEADVGVFDAYIYADGPGYGYGHTDEEGYYSIAGLQGGTYTVTAEPPYGVNLVRSSTTAEVIQGETTTVDFVLQAGGMITGRVTNEADVGVSDAFIYAYGPGDGYGYADEEGYYTIFGLPSGTYTVTAEPPYGVNLIRSSTTAEVIQGETTTVDFVLETGGTISGFVYQSDGTTPIEGAWVYANLVDGGYGRGATTAPDGSYTITGLVTGQYRVEAYAEDYISEYYDGVYDYSEATPVSVTMPDDTPNIDFTLDVVIPKYTLATNVSPAGSGAVILSPAQPAGGYDAGTTVTLTAAANAGYTFGSWSGDLAGSSNPTTLIMDSGKNVTANFVEFSAPANVDVVAADPGVEEINVDLTPLDEVDLTNLPEGIEAEEAYVVNASGTGSFTLRFTDISDASNVRVFKIVDSTCIELDVTVIDPTTIEVNMEVGDPILVFGRPCPGNQPPVADAGPDQTICAIPPATTAMVKLDGSGSHDADGDPLTYTWTWDDNTAYGVNAMVELPLGTTTITLVVNDGKVNSEPDTVNITVNPKPTANFSGAPRSSCVSLTVDFTDLSTGNPTNWIWDFGDGGTSTEQNPSHTYTSAGTYTVNLTVSNDCGSHTETKTGYITAEDCAVVITLELTPESATNILPGDDSHEFTVTVKDQYGSPMAGQNVSLETTFGNLSVNHVTIGVDGTATFTISSSEQGTATITATLGDLSDTATKIWTLELAVATTLELTPESATNILSGDDSHEFMVIVKDQHGNPMAGQNVSLETTFGNLSVNQVTTGVDGRATFTISSSEPGTAIITATLGDLSDTATKIWTLEPPVATTIELWPSTGSNLVNTTHALTATVYDQFDNVMTGVAVTWNITGVGTFAGTPESVTNSAGEASAVITSNVTGISTVTCEVTGHSSVSDTATKEWTTAPPSPTPGGGGGGAPTRYLTVDWDENITREPLYSNDRLAADLLGLNPDGSHSLLLEQGTHAPTVDGKTHYLIVIRELEEIPPLPQNTTAIVAINVTPAGAVFDRDIFLTLGFDQLPENALNATMAYYDDVNEVWVPLESEAGGPNGVAELTLSAPINHFSIFGVLVELAPTPPPPPAHFVPSGLSIVTSVERIWEPVTFVTKTGESVTITANVANDGGQEGTYAVELKLNGETVDTKIVTLGAGQSQQVSFTVSGLDYGQYEVEFAGLSDEFTTSRTITWWLIIVIIVAIGLISWGVVWGRRRRRRAAQEG